MEENVMIFLRELMLKPLIDPSTEEKIINTNRIKKSKHENSRIIGAIFCQVKRIIAWVQLINSITWGNQKWVGAIPIFTPKEIVIKLF